MAASLVLPLLAGAAASDTLESIAADAYIFAYPLVLLEMNRRVFTNVAAPASAGRAPMNQFGHSRRFPDARSPAVSPNVDTLYSIMWFDVSREPVIVSVPDSGGRYYLLPMLDLWSDVFASPGKRTIGTAAQTIAIVGPHWSGALPDGVAETRSPTAYGWVIGRTQTGGGADYAAVHKFQDGIRAQPLSRFGGENSPVEGVVDPFQDMSAPLRQVARMSGAQFFTLFAELMKRNPPHAADAPMIERLRYLGIEPGKSFRFAPPVVQAMLVTCGMIVGFDHDDTSIFERQAEFISSLPAPMISLGVLVAPPATPLYRRMAEEGRLIAHDRVAGGGILQTNIRPKLMSDAQLKAGAKWLMNQIYSPSAFGHRLEAFVETCGRQAVRQHVARPKTMPRVLTKRLAELGSEERGLVGRIAGLMERRPELSAQVLRALLYYCQVRYMLEFNGVWDPALAREEPSLAA